MSGTIRFDYYYASDIYMDVDGLSGTLDINVSVGISNNSNQSLWFQITLLSPPGGYSSYDQNLGGITSHNNSMFSWMFDRAFPSLSSGEAQDSLTIKISAYTDGSYTNLYTSVTDTITVNIIDSSDASWSVSNTNTFEGGVSGFYADDWWTYWEGANYGAPTQSSTHKYSGSYSISLGGSSSYACIKEQIAYFGTGITKGYLIFHYYKAPSVGFSVRVSGGTVFNYRLFGMLHNQWVRVCLPISTSAGWKEARFAASAKDLLWLDNIRIVGK